MPKLILSMDGLVLKEIVLNKERTTIGRKPHNDVQIDNLAISGDHACITAILDDAFLEDCNSTNGTYVNGQPIKKRILEHNDVIEMGKYRLKYLADSAAAGWKREAIDSAGLRSDGLNSGEGREPGTLSTGIRDHGGGFHAARVRILTGRSAGQELPLTKTMTTLGKPGVQVAVITRRSDGYFIFRVEGESFPLLNGLALDTEARRLGDQDILEIAGVRMAFLSTSAS